MTITKISKEGMPLLVAITGRSGSGKSTVSAHFAQKGYPVLDADVVAREITQPISPCLAMLAKAFGKDILDAQGMLCRHVLASRAFATAQGAQMLTDITHPEIVARLLTGAQKAHAQGAQIVFVDGAVIIGGRFAPHCDLIIVVTAPMKESITRIMLRDGISKEAARERLAAQLPEETLCAAANYVLKNTGAKQALLRQADVALAAIIAEGNT